MDDVVESEPTMSDELAGWVSAAREGDRTAFDALVKATYSDTYTLALRLTGNDEDARDVVQETYLRAYRGLKKFRGDARFTTWLYRITANCASSYLSRRNKHRHDELSDELHVADEHHDRDPVARSENVALRDDLKEALGKLPAKLRAVVVLRDIYDLPHDEIASELGITQSAAKVRLHRARKKLREDLFPLPNELKDQESEAEAV